MTLQAGTTIPFIADATKVETLFTIEQLAAEQKAVDKPIRALSRTPQGIVQQANAVNIDAYSYLPEAIKLTFNNATSLICSPGTLINMLASAIFGTINDPTYTDFNGFLYLKAESVLVGDKVFANNREGFLTISTIETVQTFYDPFYGMEVPMFANYFVRLTDANSETVDIVVAHDY